MDDFFDDIDLDSSQKRDEIINTITAMPSNYVGSKRRMLLHLWKCLEDNEVKFDSVFDAFSGSAMVSLMFKLMGKRVVSNDLLTSSAITAVCLLENSSIPLTLQDLSFLCKNVPKSHGDFVLSNYKDKFFTENECNFLDRYKENIRTLCGDKFYCGLDILNKATLSSIPNSNFSVYGKDLKGLRSTHDLQKSFWDEKWRDTTRKRRDVNNEIMFDKATKEVYDKYKGAFSLFSMESHVNQNCFLGGRYYNGQTVAKLAHRLQHQKSKEREITEIPMSIEAYRKIVQKSPQDATVFNSDIIDLLEAKIVHADLLYADPPYGSASSDYAVLYRFLEEYVHECKLEEMEHIQKGAKRFCKTKGYQEQFEKFLSLCGDFPTWMISYNESSYANLDTIVATIKNAGRKDVIAYQVPITYQYRKGKNEVDIEHFKNNYVDGGHKYSNRGTEYLLLAR